MRSSPLKTNDLALDPKKGGGVATVEKKKNEEPPKAIEEKPDDDLNEKFGPFSPDHFAVKGWGQKRASARV